MWGLAWLSGNLSAVVLAAFCSSEADGRFGEHIGDRNSKPGLMHQSSQYRPLGFHRRSIALRLLSCCHRSTGETAPPKGFLTACTLLRVSVARRPIMLLTPRGGHLIHAGAHAG